MGGAEFAGGTVGVGAECLVDGDTGRGRDDSGLSDAAAEGFSDPAAVIDCGGGADDDAADWGGEALGETELGRVEAGEVGWQGTGARGHRFPDSCAVEVEFDVVGTGPGGDPLALGERGYGAVEGVFEDDDARRGVVDVWGEDGVLLDVFEGEVEVV